MDVLCMLPMCVLSHLPGSRSASTIILGMDSLREKSIDLGRAWPYGDIGEDAVLLSRTIVRQIGFDPKTATGQEW